MIRTCLPDIAIPSLSELCLSAFHDLDIGILIIDEYKRVVLSNKWINESLSLESESVIGRTLEELFQNHLSSELCESIETILSKPEVESKQTLQEPLNPKPFQSIDSNIVQSVQLKSIELEQNSYCLIEISNIAESVHKQNTLNLEKERTQTILDSARDSIITLDAKGNILSANSFTCVLFDYPLRVMLSWNISDLLVSPEDVFGMDGIEKTLLNWSNELQTIELSANNSRNEYLPIELSINSYEINGDIQYIAIVRDISGKKKAEEHLNFLAHYDTLTGLANRFQFSERLNAAINFAKRHSTRFAVIFIDVDRFKFLNDTLGHDTGDKILKTTASRIQGVLRNTDTLARLGGDEFMIITESVISEQKVSTIVEKIISQTSKPIIIGERKIRVTLSMGIAMFPDNGLDEQTLVKNADAAMYEAKNEGRNNYQFFSHEMNAKIQSWLETAEDLHIALKEDQFELFFQPQIDPQQHRIPGVESLIRWKHPTKGYISPMDFIPVAEDTGLIWDLGIIVIDRACQMAQQLKRQFNEGIRVAINLSPKQFQNDDLCNILLGSCAKYRIHPQQLELEITEGLLMDNTEQSQAIISNLVQKGFSFSIDDFGTGYSSLAYLRKFPLDSLKIDRSFVTDLPNDPDAVALSKAIINLAHSLRLEVVAEGVETSEQSQFLLEHECEYLQGYLYSKPVPETELMTWISHYYDGDKP